MTFERAHKVLKNLFKKNTDLDTILYKCSKCDAKAQEYLYRVHYSYALSVALRFSKNKESASEILNDSFLKTFNFLAEGGKIKDFKTWLRKIIINRSIDYYRKNSKLKEITAFEENLPDVVITNKTLSNLTAEEIIGQLNLLPDLYRLTFVLYEIEGYSHKEICKKLDISEVASRKNLSRAKSQLKTLLQKSGVYEQA